VQKLKALEHDRYLQRKQEGKIKSIDNIGKRQQGRQIKNWKINSKTYRIRKSNISDLNEDEENELDKSALSTRSEESDKKLCGRKNIRKDRSNSYRKLKKAEDEILKGKRLAAMYRKRLQRAQTNVQAGTPSPRTKVRKVYGGK